MLFVRSASFTRMTLRSCTMASIILRKLSAWRSSAEKKSSLVSLVTPSTQCATSGPKSSADLLDRRARVFHHVVQQSGFQRYQVHPHVRQEAGYRKRVDDVRFARFPVCPS